MSHRLRNSQPGRRRQRGVVLVVALIMLVAMSLAGVAMMRSVETAVVAAGNFAFKEAGVQVADRGVQAAANWLSTPTVAGATLYSDIPAEGYFSALPNLDPDYFDMGSWAGSKLLNSTPDGSGNVVRYVVHRMCTQPGVSWDAAGNQCALQTTLASSEGGSRRRDAPKIEGPPLMYYRVTTRVDGPRNTVTVTQTSLAVQI